ncbi:hypothetical protein ACJX0J_017955, partial [Zea mays]
MRVPGINLKIVKPLYIRGERDFFFDLLNYKILFQIQVHNASNYFATPYASNLWTLDEPQNNFIARELSPEADFKLFFSLLFQVMVRYE